MANHRTLTELKPFNGFRVLRLTIDGKRLYYAERGKEKTPWMETSLKGIHNAIEREETFVFDEM